MRFLLKRRLETGILLIACFTAAFMLSGAFLSLDNRMQDRLVTKPETLSPDIVIIGIDDEALERFGQFYTWDRQIMADAIGILNSDPESKPAVIAVDIIYSEMGANPEGDAALAAEAEAGGNVVLVSHALIGNDANLNTVVLDIENPYAGLNEAAEVGFSNTVIASDGVVREAEFSMSYGDKRIYSFPYEVYKKYTGQTAEYAEAVNKIYIPYRSLPGEYIQYSFADIFEEDFDPSYFADCVVFIGNSSVGLGDMYPTPASAEKQMFGVEIHANVLKALLDNNFKQYASIEVNLLMIILIAVSLCLISKKAVHIFAALLAALIFVYISAVSIVYHTQTGYLLTVFYPLLLFGAALVYKIFLSYLIEIIEKQKVKAVFMKYTDPKLVDQLIEKEGANVSEEGVRKDIVVLFVDVRGFTTMAEELKDAPEIVVKILNEYLEMATNAVFINGGSVDKFIGDAVMALFNGFYATEDYYYKAVKAAWDIVQGANAVNNSIKEKYGFDVGFGVGVNCGTAIVGNLGPSFRKDYTAIGDTVNTAARLESNAKRSEVLISGELYEKVKDRVKAEAKGKIALKGKIEGVDVYSVKEMIF